MLSQRLQTHHLYKNNWWNCCGCQLQSVFKKWSLLMAYFTVATVIKVLKQIPMKKIKFLPRWYKNHVFFPTLGLTVLHLIWRLLIINSTVLTLCLPLISLFYLDHLSTNHKELRYRRNTSVPKEMTKVFEDLNFIIQ